jgi:hypothetical protein
MDNIDKKIQIANDNLLLLEYMIKVWKYAINTTWTNCPRITRRTQYSGLESMLVMLQNSIAQKRIMLNTLMARDKKYGLEIDPIYALNDLM